MESKDWAPGIGGAVQNIFVTDYWFFTTHLYTYNNNNNNNNNNTVRCSATANYSYINTSSSNYYTFLKYITWQCLLLVRRLNIGQAPGVFHWFMTGLLDQKGLVENPVHVFLFIARYPKITFCLGVDNCKLRLIVLLIWITILLFSHIKPIFLYVTTTKFLL